MVRDKAGRKMSKSLGNVIDPIHVIKGITLDDLLSGLQVRLVHDVSLHMGRSLTMGIRMQSGNVSEQERKKAEKELRREFPKGIPACGTDALRYALASYLQQGTRLDKNGLVWGLLILLILTMTIGIGRQINMDLQRVISHRQFCNKIWNAVRYALPLLEANGLEATTSVESMDVLRTSGKMSLLDRWILSRLVRSTTPR
jgi:valyl-tRNA synthetase